MAGCDSAGGDLAGCDSAGCDSAGSTSWPTLRQSAAPQATSAVMSACQRAVVDTEVSVIAFWNRSLSPPQADPKHTSLPPPKEQHRAATETVAVLLRYYAAGGFDTALTSVRELVRRCEYWAEQAQLAAPTQRVVLQGSTAAPKRGPWTELVQFFTEQRMAEKDSVLESQSQMADAVRSFSRTFHDFLGQDREADHKLSSAMLRIAQGLERTDTQQVLHAAQELVKTVTLASEQRRLQLDKRRQNLEHAALKLERQVAGNRSPGCLDQVTRLYTRAAFNEHLDFISAIGRLFATPPVLHLFTIDVASAARLDRNPDEVALSIADELLRVFYAREYYVARVSDWCFAVCSVGLALGQAQVMTREAHHRITANATLRTLKLTAVSASLIAGESREEWCERAVECASDEGPTTVRMAEVPAQFDDGPSPDETRTLAHERGVDPNDSEDEWHGFDD